MNYPDCANFFIVLTIWKMVDRILVIDDEKNITFVIQAMLEKAGFKTLVFNNSVRARDAIGQEEISAVVTDLYMPGPGGMEILKYCQKNYPQ